MTLYKEQFVEDFWPEKAVVAALQDNGWTDVSYGNDSCPSWQWGRYKLSVDAADPQARDFGGFGFRFYLYKDDGTVNPRLIIESNDIDDVIDHAVLREQS